MVWHENITKGISEKQKSNQENENEIKLGKISQRKKWLKWKTGEKNSIYI